MSTCSHKWSMTNIRHGYLVVEGCYRCKARCCFFSTEARPPVDDYVDGEHFWTYRGSYQATKFDLACGACGEEVDLNDLMGLMLSTCQDPECTVARTAREAGEGAWVYVALCADTTHASGRCVSDRGIRP